MCSSGAARGWYEVAPFGARVSFVQRQRRISVLTWGNAAGTAGLAEADMATPFGARVGSI